MRWLVAPIVLLGDSRPPRRTCSSRATSSRAGWCAARCRPAARSASPVASCASIGTGRFLLGFGRDEASGQELTVRYPDGSALTRRLEIAERDYRIERIDGLPPRQVTPRAAGSGPDRGRRAADRGRPGA